MHALPLAAGPGRPAQAPLPVPATPSPGRGRRPQGRAGRAAAAAGGSSLPPPGAPPPQVSLARQLQTCGGTVCLAGFTKLLWMATVFQGKVSLQAQLGSVFVCLGLVWAGKSLVDRGLHLRAGVQWGSLAAGLGAIVLSAFYWK